jgi:hypothetical protein
MELPFEMRPRLDGRRLWAGLRRCSGCDNGFGESPDGQFEKNRLRSPDPMDALRGGAPGSEGVPPFISQGRHGVEAAAPPTGVVPAPGDPGAIVCRQRPHYRKITIYCKEMALAFSNNLPYVVRSSALVTAALQRDTSRNKKLVFFMWSWNAANKDL